VSYRDMEAVLNFMYHGEVNVAQDDLNSFLQVAEDLRVKGKSRNLLSNCLIKEYIRIFRFNTKQFWKCRKPKQKISRSSQT
jgi:hypothetical protein